MVHRQGMALIRSMEAGARSGIKMRIWQEDSIANLIREVAKDDSIEYIYLFDAKGKITHHSDPSSQEETTTWRVASFGSDWVNSRIVKLSNGSKVYEIAKYFSPVQASLPGPQKNGTASKNLYAGVHQHFGETIVFGMRLRTFEAARRSDLNHAYVMAAILMVLGASTFFFVFIVQNYYLVERTLKKTQDYTQQLVASMASGLLSIDTNGKVVSSNRAALKLLGRKETELLGKNLRSILDVESSGIQSVLKNPKTSSEREITYHKTGGEAVPLNISASPVFEETGTCSGLVVEIKDLTEIKLLEEKVRRSEKLAAIGKLAAGVAHEIRNPMSSISGFAHFLRHALTDRPQEREYAEIMIKEMDRINRVVSDLLSFARPGSTELVPTNIADLIEHVISLVEADAKTKNVNIQSNIDADLGEIIVDSYQVTQALLNLVLNALRFSEDGLILVHATTDSNRSRLTLQVEDNGSGIPPENMTNIFDPFFTTHAEGTGLGLAIVHKIVENHHGEIKVESPLPGTSGGTCFTITIPIS
ncbi:MAG: PAS domain-containing protein [Desulfobacterales bacterium]|nr:MAG: PAS domain-containing protein [Desulfobacterales bacterium]